MSLYIGQNDNTLKIVSNRCDKDLVIDVLRKYMKKIIGQIRLLAVVNIPTVLLNSDLYGRYISRMEGFDGWVILDGSYYDKTAFGDAYSVFGDKYGSDGNFFRIPEISDFFNVKNLFLSKMEKRECITYIPDHEHEIHTEITFKANGVIRNAFKMVSCSQTGQDGTIHNPENIESRTRVGYSGMSISSMMPGNAYQGWYVGGHNGNGSGEFRKSDVVFNTSTSFAGIPVGYTGNEIPNSYPINNKVIAVTYIGF